MEGDIKSCERERFGIMEKGDSRNRVSLLYLAILLSDVYVL